VFFIEERAQSNGFDGESAYACNGIVLNTRHTDALVVEAQELEEIGNWKAVQSVPKLVMVWLLCEMETQNCRTTLPYTAGQAVQDLSATRLRRGTEEAGDTRNASFMLCDVKGTASHNNFDMQPGKILYLE
jgi:hypothetical protein